MIQIQTLKVEGFEVALHGMRNPKDSWGKADTHPAPDTEAGCMIGDNDFNLALTLSKGGSVHGKYRRMIHASADIIAPLYWWKEFDTYRIGVEKDSCSTMHTLHKRDLTGDDFSYEHLFGTAETMLVDVINLINRYRRLYVEALGKNDPNAKDYWWQMIQLLPSSYNQRRTVQMSYEALWNMWLYRSNHKLDEWRDFCHWIEKLPYADLIIAGGLNG